MNADKVGAAPEQVQQSVSLQTRGDIGGKFVIRRIIPITEVMHSDRAQTYASADSGGYIRSGA